MKTEQKKTDAKPAVDGNGDIDAKELAKRIQKRVDEKMASGFYDEQEVKGITSLELDPSDDGLGWLFYNTQKADHVYGLMEEKWDVTKPVDTSSPRGGSVGKLVALYKKLFAKFVQPTINISLAKQAEFNSETTHYVYHLKEAALRAEQEFSALRDRYLNLSDRIGQLEKNSKDTANILKPLQGLEKRIEDQMDTRFAPLDIRVEQLAKSLKDVDKQGIFLKRRISKTLESILDAAKDGGQLADTVKTEREKLNSFDYTLFENLHRGTREEIKSRLTIYTDLFKDCSPVVDIGCGRGELTELLGENGITTHGVDMNEEMVAECKERGLDVIQNDAISYLRSVADGALGGIAGIQFIEHLPNDVMMEFFHLSFEKLRTGGVIAAETVNPTCLSTFCGAFYLDMSHDKPVHPLAVHFALERIGFRDVRIEYLNPFPPGHMLEKFQVENHPDIPSEIMIEYNRNIDRLNGVLYSHQDYAVVARK